MMMMMMMIGYTTHRGVPPPVTSALVATLSKAELMPEERVKEVSPFVLAFAFGAFCCRHK